MRIGQANPCEVEGLPLRHPLASDVLVASRPALRTTAATAAMRCTGCPAPRACRGVDGGRHAEQLRQYHLDPGTAHQGVSWLARWAARSPVCRGRRRLHTCRSRIPGDGRVLSEVGPECVFASLLLPTLGRAALNSPCGSKVSRQRSLCGRAPSATSMNELVELLQTGRSIPCGQ